jgi:hypothetical protein
LGVLLYASRVFGSGLSSGVTEVGVSMAAVAGLASSA